MPDSANVTTAVIITAVVIFAESGITVLIAVCYNNNEKNKLHSRFKISGYVVGRVLHLHHI